MRGKNNLFVAAFVACICCTIHGATSFSLNNKFNAARTQQQPTTTKHILESVLQQPSFEDEHQSSQIVVEDLTNNNSGLRQSLFSGCLTFLTTTPLSAFAAVDELEIEELPPVYVPILFAIGVIGGVGWLTASLGNVMDEGEIIILIESWIYFSACKN